MQSSVFSPKYFCYNNNMPEQHRSDRRSLTPNYQEHRKRKDSNVKLMIAVSGQL